jgi:hypothetical protein
MSALKREADGLMVGAGAGGGVRLGQKGRGCVSHGRGGMKVAEGAALFCPTGAVVATGWWGAVGHPILRRSALRSFGAGAFIRRAACALWRGMTGKAGQQAVGWGALQHPAAQLPQQFIFNVMTPVRWGAEEHPTLPSAFGRR